MKAARPSSGLTGEPNNCSNSDWELPRCVERELAHTTRFLFRPPKVLQPSEMQCLEGAKKAGVQQEPGSQFECGCATRISGFSSKDVRRGLHALGAKHIWTFRKDSDPIRQKSRTLLLKKEVSLRLTRALKFFQVIRHRIWTQCE